MHDYRLCGWRVHSELPLPDLLPWTGDPQAPLDLHIELGSIEERLAKPLHEGPFLQLGADGTCRFGVDRVAAYRIAPDGRTIRVQPDACEDFPAVRAFLLGSVFAISCQRRGVLPLHACSVRLPSAEGDVAVAFSAPSGTGKSTLASAFLRRGYSILADDVTVLSLGAEGALALPTFPRVKLWGDALGRFGYCPEGAERVRQGMDKFSIGLGQEGFAGDASLRLVALYHLERINDIQHAGLTRVVGLDASVRFTQALYQQRVLMHVAADRAAHLSLTTQLAASIASHSVLRQVAGFDHLDDLVTRIAAFHAGVAEPA